MSDMDSDNDWKKFETAPDDDIGPIDTGLFPPPGAGANPSPGGGFPPPNLPPSNLPPANFRLPDMPAAIPGDPDQPGETRIGMQEEDVAPLFVDEKNIINKGDYIDLLRKDPTLRQVYVGAGWEHRRFDAEKIDIDLTCFLLDRKDETRNNEDFIFYNSEFACDGAVQHKGDSRTGAGEGDDELIFVDLNGVPYEILKVMFVLSVYDPDLLGLTFDAVRDMYIRFVNNDDNHEIARLRIDDDLLMGNNAILALCLVRDGPRWHLEAVAQPSRGGLAAVASSYGIIVKENQG